MDDEFFAGIDQVELKVDGGTAKFPIFYRDARMFTLMLPANLLKLKRMLPDPRFTPAQVLPGVGALALTAFEYYDTDVAPYNEFMMGIVLNSPYYAPVPCYNILRQLISGIFSVYIYHLPVTTELALRAGVDFYNYPKFVADIDFSDSDGRIACDLHRGGQRILTMSGPKPPTRTLGEMKFMCNLYQSRQPQLAEFKVNAIDAVMKWSPADVAWSFDRGDPMGAAAADVVLGSRAVMYMYMPRIQAVLYGPENLSFPLMRHAITSPGFMPPARKAARKAPAKKPATSK